MPKIRRVIEEGVYYHVTTRGNNQQTVFLEPKDYHNYLEILKKYKIEFGAKIFGYCPMPNHTHIALLTQQASDLPKFMHRVNMLYARRFNKTYKRVGHLWESRYYNKPIRSEEQLFATIQYIENNPVRANLVNHPKDWQWSSYNARVTGHYNDLLDQIPGY